MLCLIKRWIASISLRLTLGGAVLTAIALWFLPLNAEQRDRLPAEADSAHPPTALPPASMSTVSLAELRHRWIINAAEARYLIQSGAIVLDARGKSSGTELRLQGAIPVTWQAFSQEELPGKGNLIRGDAELEQKIQALGISNSVPVVVFGDPLRGWGEEGRIVWMLRALGHESAVWVDGGIQALQKASVPSAVPGTALAEPSPSTGTFTIQRRSDWSVTQLEVRRSLQTHSFLLIDTREQREYNGDTPYGETRGGHLPGAVHLYYKTLLDENGKLRSQSELLRILRDRGITRDSNVVAYCTGGIRSAWVVSVLNDLGFNAKNYAGSTWEWSASPASDYPLEVPD